MKPLNLSRDITLTPNQKEKKDRSSLLDKCFFFISFMTWAIMPLYNFPFFVPYCDHKSCFAIHFAQGRFIVYSLSLLLSSKVQLSKNLQALFPRNFSCYFLILLLSMFFCPPYFP